MNFMLQGEQKRLRFWNPLPRYLFTGKYWEQSCIYLSVGFIQIVCCNFNVCVCVFSFSFWVYLKCICHIDRLITSLTLFLKYKRHNVCVIKPVGVHSDCIEKRTLLVKNAKKKSWMLYDFGCVVDKIVACL